MKRIGLIGGVGTGKSIVADILEKYFNSFVIKADTVGHEIIKKGTPSYQLIVDYFGKEILNSEEEIDRSKLGPIVMNEKTKLNKLNSFTHPFIYDYIKNQVLKTMSEGSYQYIVIEVPLMIEAGFDDLVDENWYIHTDLEIRKQRLKDSRNYSDEKINSILSNQLSDEKYRENANYEIDNNGEIDETVQQIKDILSGGKYD
ncbi:dephospho-CoA kinase [Natranaerovirga pectinivora]|uniref:Dephospho-CoA kinase n=1 Tax=Natranaerovirga pectinivora TaxID=682400 RepID=A0A4R3MQE1_9FIRM|nr:dephospho-CoA kinase [Natranaerovirga pectinivora]TCT17102.1 dephospho-CoA kinase [Natranaerovirga pectinivora]